MSSLGSPVASPRVSPVAGRVRGDRYRVCVAAAAAAAAVSELRNVKEGKLSSKEGRNIMAR